MYTFTYTDNLNDLVSAINAELYRQHIAEVKRCYTLAWRTTRLFSEPDIMIAYLTRFIGATLARQYTALALKSADMRNAAIARGN